MSMRFRAELMEQWTMHGNGSLSNCPKVFLYHFIYLCTKPRLFIDHFTDTTDGLYCTAQSAPQTLLIDIFRCFQNGKYFSWHFQNLKICAPKYQQKYSDQQQNYPKSLWMLSMKESLGNDLNIFPSIENIYIMIWVS